MSAEFQFFDVVAIYHEFICINIMNDRKNEILKKKSSKIFP